MEVVFGGAGHEFINVVEFRLRPEFPDFFMELLNFKAVLFDSFIELFFEVLNHSFFFPELLVFVIDDSLKSFDGLLSGLGNSGIFFFVIGFDLFLAVQEPSGIGLELAAGELGLHDKRVCGYVHLAAKVHEFVHGAFRDYVLDCGLEVMDFSLLVHELLF